MTTGRYKRPKSLRAEHAGHYTLPDHAKGVALRSRSGFRNDATGSRRKLFTIRTSRS
jgi:hypothetical protein